jgi:hypothetical protein
MNCGREVVVSGHMHKERQPTIVLQASLQLHQGLALELRWIHFGQLPGAAESGSSPGPAVSNPRHSWLLQAI